MGFIQSNERSQEQNSDFRKKEKISPGQPHNHLSELLATNLFIYLYKLAGDDVYVYRVLYIYIYIKFPTSCLSGRP